MATVRDVQRRSEVEGVQIFSDQSGVSRRHNVETGIYSRYYLSAHILGDAVKLFSFIEFPFWMRDDSREVHVAIVGDKMVASGGQGKLVSAVRSRISIDPDKEPIIYANAERKLLFRRLGQDRIDYVDVAEFTGRHKKQTAPLLELFRQKPRQACLSLASRR